METTTLKTYESCLDENAGNRGFPNFVEWLHNAQNRSWNYHVEFYKEAAFLYASYKEESAFQAGYNRGDEERGKS